MAYAKSTLYSEHRKMRAKQQHVCKEMNIYEQYQPEVVFKFQHRMYNRSESILHWLYRLFYRIDVDFT
jgi:RecA-family ATPase